MNREYDFARAERGKFFKPGANLKIPVYLDTEVRRFIAEIADTRKVDMSKVVNDLLRSDMKLAKVMR